MDNVTTSHCHRIRQIHRVILQKKTAPAPLIGELQSCVLGSHRLSYAKFERIIIPFDDFVMLVRERNLKEVQHNYTKDHNRIDRNRLEKIVFVRRFIHLKIKLCFNENVSYSLQRVDQ